MNTFHPLWGIALGAFILMTAVPAIVFGGQSVEESPLTLTMFIMSCTGTIGMLLFVPLMMGRFLYTYIRP